MENKTSIPYFVYFIVVFLLSCNSGNFYLYEKELSTCISFYFIAWLFFSFAWVFSCMFSGGVGSFVEFKKLKIMF